MNPLAKYTLARLVLFVAALAAVSWAGAGLLLALAVAAVVSALLSYVLLRPMRDQVAQQIAGRVDRRLAGAKDPASMSRRERRRAEDDAAEDAAAERIAAEQRAAEQLRAAQAGDQPPSAAEGQAQPEQG